MRILVTKWFGVVLVEDGRESQRALFPADARAIADRLLKIRHGEILEEETRLASPGVTVTVSRLKRFGPVKPHERLPVLSPGHPLDLFREAALLVGRDETRKTSGEKDRIVVAGVRALDELTKTGNTLTERVRDWYSLHYPEAVRAVPDAAKFALALAENPDREDLSKRLGLGDPATSIGVAFAEEDLQAISRVSRALKGLLEERDRTEKLLEKQTKVIAPTLSGVVGPLLAARLLAQANGLERLAMLPASTVQTLGAENALFLHLKDGNRPPKHGVLFQHPLVNVAPRWHRGKLSRLLATQASIAARLDHFTPDGGDRSAPLRAHIEEQVERIKKTKAPTGQPKPQQRASGGTPQKGPGGHWATRKAHGSGGGKKTFPGHRGRR